jgi:hypothetical protein
MNEIQAEREIKNDEGKGEENKRDRGIGGEMVVHEKNLYIGEWDEVTMRDKGDGLERSGKSKKDYRTIEIEWERRGISAIEGKSACDRQSQRYNESQCRKTCCKVTEVVAVACEGGGTSISVCIECCARRGVSSPLYLKC